MELGGTRPKAIAIGSAVALALACAACAAPPAVGPVAVAVAAPTAKIAPPVAAAAAVVEAPAPTPLAEAPVEYEKSWQGFGIAKCAYLAPKTGFIGSDGSIDVVVQFHAGQMADRDIRASGLRGVFVSCGYGIGTGGYSKAFEDSQRFGFMMKSLSRTIGAAAKRRDVHLRRLALASWSAGFASVNRILSVPEWYEATDTVVLLDSLHAQYIDPNPETPAQGADRVDVRMLRRFIRFATDAAAGKKTMVITHSSIVPPDYASTSEATAALLTEIGLNPVAGTPEDDSNDPAVKLPGVTGALTVRVDQGGLHVRGFRGIGPHDHFDHLHLIGVALRSWLVPRWYTPASERP